MRLWHKDLIPYLPKQQLIAQWRECCAICLNIANKGTPNHILVNKVMNYLPVHFIMYVREIIGEFNLRDYKVSKKSLDNFIKNFERFGDSSETLINGNIFADWHNERYLKQCLFNLQEKYDCGGISEEEWKIIENNFGQYLN